MHITEKNRRVALGFLEHVGSISIARYPGKNPKINWQRVLHSWDGKAEGEILRRLTPDIPGLHMEYYVCDGRLLQHVDEVDDGVITMGIVLQGSEDLQLNASGSRIEIGEGDIFALDPKKRHGAETNKSFVFATRDYRLHELPTLEKFRRKTEKDLRKISAHYPVLEPA